MDKFNLENKKNDKAISNLLPVISPGLAAFIGLFGVFILYQIGGSVITLIIFGFDLENADVNALRLMTMAGQILLILLPALLLAKYVYVDVTTAMRFKLPRLTDVIIFVAGLAILLPLFQSYLYIQNYIIENLASHSDFINQIKQLLDQLDKLVESAYGDLLTANNIPEGILIVLVIAVTPAVCEEFLFRGFIQTSFELSVKPYLAMFLTALFFGLYHFNPYGLLPLIALGFYLSYSVHVTESIGVAVVLHFINNFFSVILYFIFGNEEIVQSNVSDPENIGQYFSAFILLAIFFVIFITFIHRYYKNMNGGQDDLSEV